jgi:threonine dehydratase
VTFAHVSKLVDDVVTVTEEDISRALLMLLERSKLLAEPAGAAALAGLLTGAVTPAPRAVIVAIVWGATSKPTSWLAAGYPTRGVRLQGSP